MIPLTQSKSRKIIRPSFGWAKWCSRFFCCCLLFLNFASRLDCLHLTHSFYVMCDWKAHRWQPIPTWNMFMSMSIRGFMRFPWVCVSVCWNGGGWSKGKKGMPNKRSSETARMNQEKTLWHPIGCSIFRYIYIYTWFYLFGMKCTYAHRRTYISISIFIEIDVNLLWNWPKLLTLTKIHKYAVSVYPDQRWRDSTKQRGWQAEMLKYFLVAVDGIVWNCWQRSMTHIHSTSFSPCCLFAFVFGFRFVCVFAKHFSI